jgi:hypothetical protein
MGRLLVFLALVLALLEKLKDLLHLERVLSDHSHGILLCLADL